MNVYLTYYTRQPRGKRWCSTTVHGVTKSRARGGGSGASGWRSVCGRGQRTPSTHSSLTIIINTGVFRYYIIITQSRFILLVSSRFSSSSNSNYDRRWYIHRKKLYVTYTHTITVLVLSYYCMLGVCVPVVIIQTYYVLERRSIAALPLFAYGNARRMTWNG